MSYTQIGFLDTTVKFGENRALITTLYNKPTDTHLYLEHSSAHPNSILTKGPYGQYIRLRRICSLDHDFELNAKKLTAYYLKRGYPFKSLKKHYHRARKYSQDELLTNPPIGSLVRNNWNIIQNTEELTQIFKDKPLVGYRRLPNLKDMLTSSSINYPPVPKPLGTPPVHVPACTRLGKCTYCPKIKKVEQITSFHSKRIFKCQALPLKHKITCELSNVIYMINCNQCGLQYTGETKRPIRNRMYEHYSSVLGRMRT